MSHDQEFTHAYVGYRKDGTAVMITIDDGGKTTASEVAKLLRKGGHVERLPIEQAREAFIKAHKPTAGSQPR